MAFGNWTTLRTILDPLVLRMRRNSHISTSMKNLTTKLSFAGLHSYRTRNIGNCTMSSAVFINFLLRVRRNGHSSISGPILTPNLTTHFGSNFTKIYACFERKTAFVMQNFGIWGLVGGCNFLTKPHETHPDFILSRMIHSVHLR